MASIHGSVSGSASDSAQGQGPRSGRKALWGEESEPSPKYIHVHQFKGTGLYGAWFNDPTVRGKKKRLYFGSHQTAYLAARAQDRAALKYRPHAADPRTVRLNFKEEDYVQDEKLRKMLTNQEFGKLLCKESRLNYTKMERTPCLMQFYKEELAKGNLVDEYASKPITVTLQQYLDKVMHKRRCPVGKKKLKKPSNKPPSAAPDPPVPAVPRHNLRVQDNVMHTRRFPAEKNKVKKPSHKAPSAAPAPAVSAVPLHNLEVQVSAFSKYFPLDFVKIPKKKRSEKTGRVTQTSELASLSRRGAVGALPHKPMVEAAVTSSPMPSFARATRTISRRLPKDRNEPTREILQGSEKRASNPATKSITGLNKTKKRNLEEPREKMQTDARKKMRTVEQLVLRDEMKRDRRMEKPTVHEKNKQPGMEVPRAAEKNKRPRMEVPKAAEKNKQPMIEVPKAPKKNKRPRMGVPKAAEKNKQPMIEVPKAPKKNKRPRMEVPKAPEEKKKPRMEDPKAAEEEEKRRMEDPKAAEEKEKPTMEDLEAAEEEEKPAMEDPKAAEEKEKPSMEDLEAAEEEEKPAMEDPKAAEEKEKPTMEDLEAAEEEEKPAMEDPKAAEEKEKPTMEDLEAAYTLAAGLCAAQQTLPDQKSYSNKWSYKNAVVRAKAAMAVAAAAASASASASTSHSAGAQSPTVPES